MGAEGGDRDQRREGNVFYSKKWQRRIAFQYSFRSIIIRSYSIGISQGRSSTLR